MIIPDDVQNILVLENHNHIGDMLCSLSMFQALKKKYSSAHITLVVAPTSYQIPFFEINPYINKILLFDKSSLGNEFSFLRQLRNQKYQIGIVPSTKTVSRTLHILNFLSGAELRVGAKSIDGSKNLSQKLLNIKSDFLWKDKHQLDRSLEVVRQIGCDLSEDEVKAIKFDFGDEEVSFANNYLKGNFPNNSRKIIAFHPGAGKIANTWSANNFAEIIIKLYAVHNNYVLITKGLVDDAIVNEVSKVLNTNRISHSILFNCGIKKLGAILSKLNLFITNDTGTMHIAGFSDAKIISLFGPTNPNEWAPRGGKQLFVKSKSGNINDISVREVFDLANKILTG